MALYKSTVRSTLILLLICTGALAQYPKCKAKAFSYFDRLDKANGLSNNTVNDIIQGPQSYLWMGTNNGLNKFDGREFKVYKTTQYPTLRSANIRCMWADSNTLWLGTIGGGVYRFHPLQERFEQIPCALNEVHTIVPNRTNSALWLGGKEGLFQLNLHDSLQCRQILANRDVQSIAQTDTGIWVATAHGVLFVHENGIRQQIGPTQLHSEFVFDIEQVSDSVLWIATRHLGLQLLNLHSQQMSPFTQQYTCKAEHSTAKPLTDVRKIYRAQDGSYLIATDGAGLLQVDAERKQYVRYLTGANEYGIASNTLFSVYEDHNHNFWLGHVRKGISIIDNHRDRVGVHLNTEAPNDFSSTLMIYQAPKGETYLGTDGHGLYRYGQPFKKMDFKGTGEILNDAYVQAMLVDSHGNYWVGTFSRGLHRFTSNKEPLPLPFKVNDVRAILEDGNGTVWIASYGRGFIKYDYATNSFQHFSHQPDNANSLCNNNIFAMQYLDHKLYIATYGGGLSVFDCGTEDFTHIEHKPLTNNGLLDNNLVCLYAKDSSNIWVGGLRGLNHVVLGEEDTVLRYDLSQMGLDSYVSAIHVDGANRVWFSTDAGIYNLQTQPQAFLKVNLGPLFNNTEFHLNAVLANNKGKLLWGSAKGVFSFYPHNVFERTVAASPRITGLKINGQEQSADGMHYLTAIQQNGQLALSASQNTLTVQYATLRFPSSQDIAYQIRMVGVDKDWQHAGQNRSATYSNLSPGEYTFMVHSSNVRGTWSKPVQQFSIRIQPPWWRSYWAISFYALFLAFIYLLKQYYTNRLDQLKSKLELELVQREKNEEIHQLKLAFFTNISHDLRTPLTLILGTIKRMAREYREGRFPSKQGLAVIENNANRLLLLSNELLDFRRLEMGKLKLKPSQTQIVPFAKEVYLSFYGHAHERQISYEFVADETLQTALFIDPEQMEKVLFNLLSNAFKFTPDKGRVMVLVQGPQQGEICLQVRNYGQVLSEAQQSNIFDRFYQSASSLEDNAIGPGTGIGLSIVKDIVALHNGRIELQSNHEEGTSFKVLLPLDAQATVTPLEPSNSKMHDLAEYKTPIDTSLHKAQAPTPNPFKGALVLIVEDHHELRAFLRSSLETDYRVLDAENGKQALELAQKELPDLVISDVMMPEMDGISLCLKLKTNVRTSHVPVILLTAKKSAMYKMKGFETGADDYISKPFDEDELKVRIRNLLQVRENLRQKYLLDASMQPEQLELTSPDEKFLTDLRQIIADNLENSDLKAELIAREIGMSHSLVYKKLKALTGMSIVEFVRDQRLRKAESLLVQQKLPVGEVCFMVGFGDRNYFTQWFKKKYKLSPRDYVKAQTEPSADAD